MKRRVLLVGAGRRVQNNFLPALTCLSETFDIAGIHARTSTRMVPLAARWNVPAVERLADVDFTSVDTVAISVPLEQNAPVLRTLLPYAGLIDIVIDTPIAGTVREFAAAAALLPRFKSVLVTEDYMNFPQFALLREAVKAGRIGNIKSVTLTNTGYEYHGLALIRSFAAFAPYRTSWYRPLGPSAAAVGYGFSGGFSASVIGPYRRHAAGGIVVEGSNGIITEFPIDLANAKHGKRHYLLRPDYRSAQLCGYRIEGKGTEPIVADLPQLARMRAMTFDDQSDFNLLRGCGLMSVFEAFNDSANINRRYGFENALYDAVTGKLSRRGRMPRVDALTWMGGNYVTLLRSAMRLAGDRTMAAPVSAEPIAVTTPAGVAS